MELAENLRLLRMEANKTLKEVSDEIGLTIGYISDLERGAKTNPSAEALNKLADYYQVTVDFLLGRTIDRQEMILQKLKEDGEFKEIRIKHDKRKEGKIKLLLHEARGLNEEDIQRIITIARAWKKGRLDNK